MRLYTPIWNKLKQEKQVEVACEDDFHSRVIHAVVNEKYADTQLRKAVGLPGYGKLVIIRKPGRLQFKLSKAVPTVEDL